LEFNQSEERKPVFGLMNFALIDQNHRHEDLNRWLRWWG